MTNTFFYFPANLHILFQMDTFRMGKTNAVFVTAKSDLGQTNAIFVFQSRGRRSGQHVLFKKISII